MTPMKDHVRYPKFEEWFKASKRNGLMKKAYWTCWLASGKALREEDINAQKLLSDQNQGLGNEHSPVPQTSGGEHVCPGTSTGDHVDDKERATQEGSEETNENR